MPTCDFVHVETYQSIIQARVARERLLDAGQIQAMHEVLQDHVNRHGRPSLVIDMHEVGYMSSAAIGKLVALHKQVKGSKGRMAIAGLRDSLKPLFKVTGLDKLFDFQPDAGALVQEWRRKPIA
jgi:anti-sigma B factor antagonist